MFPMIRDGKTRVGGRDLAGTCKGVYKSQASMVLAEGEAILYSSFHLPVTPGTFQSDL